MKLYYLNALFDLELGHFPVAAVQQAASEMTVLFAVLAQEGDRVLIDCDVPGDYASYLESNGIGPLHFVKMGELAPGLKGEAWGWNRRAWKVLTLAGATCDNPDFRVVKHANSRECCSAIGLEYGIGVPGSTFCSNLEQVGCAIKALSGKYPLVVKPAFGGSGSGFVKLEQFPDGQDLQRISNMCLRGGCVVEPWCARVADISGSFQVHEDGLFGKARFHQCHVNAHGAFYAVYIDPNDERVQRWRDKLENSFSVTNRYLHKMGYRGPVGCDSFVFRNEMGEEQLAPVIEINARHVMSDLAWSLHDRLAPDRFCYFRFISSRRSCIPENYKVWNDLLSPYLFDKTTRVGVIPVTPLRIKTGSEWRQCARSAFFIAATSQEEIFRIDDYLRKQLQPQPGNDDA